MSPLERRVSEIVANITKCSPEQLRPDMDLRKELNVDSLQGLMIVAAIEKKFGVLIPDDELDNYATIQMIAGAIQRLQSGDTNAS